MTTEELRDYFAGLALNGLLASVSHPQIRDGFLQAAEAKGLELPDMYALMAYNSADAMLKFRLAHPFGKGQPGKAGGEAETEPAPPNAEHNER